MNPPTQQNQAVPQQISDIVEQLDLLCDGLVRCLQDDDGFGIDLGTLCASLDRQKALLVELETALDIALGDGSPPEQIDALIARFERTHEHCRLLLRQHISNLEQTLLALQVGQNHQGTYLEQKACAAAGLLGRKSSPAALPPDPR